MLKRPTTNARSTNNRSNRAQSVKMPRKSGCGLLIVLIAVDYKFDASSTVSPSHVHSILVCPDDATAGESGHNVANQAFYAIIILERLFLFRSFFCWWIKPAMENTGRLSRIAAKNGLRSRGVLQLQSMATEFHAYGDMTENFFYNGILASLDL